MTDVITKQHNVKLNDIQESKYLIITDVINRVKNKKIESDTFTQFGYACHQLGISLFSSSVPQKKGRVERAFGTLQSRLVPLFRLENIQTIEEENNFLKSYLKVFNSQFSITNYNTSKFEVVDNINTNLILSVNSIRKINSGYHFKYKNKLYIPINSRGYIF